MYQERVRKVRERFSLASADALFITNPKNIFYLTGFCGLVPEDREASLLITFEHVLLFLPAMYELQGKQCKGVREGVCELVIELERDALLTKFSEYVAPKARVIIESCNIRIQEYEEMKIKTGVLLLPEPFFVEEFRLIKDSFEREMLKRAVDISESIFDELVLLLSSTDFTQLFELDLVDEMRRLTRKHGGHGFGFLPIVASGAGSALPHYSTGEKKLQRNAPLLFDFGMTYDGYTADITRTIYIGNAPEDFRKTYEQVLTAHDRAIASCRAGITSGEVYDAANNFFKQEGVDKYFLHGLGHGFGLDVHELPYSRASQETVLKEGMTLTIEPGLYYEGRFGVRIEDDVIITATGCEVLSAQNKKELIEIPVR